MAGIAGQILQTQRVAKTLGLSLAIGVTLEVRDASDQLVFIGSADEIADRLIDISLAKWNPRYGKVEN